jgi:hypothetical protein
MDYEEFFKREAHEIIKKLALLDTMLPWADLDHAEKLLNIYDNIKYTVDKRYRDEVTQIAGFDSITTHLSINDLAKLVREAVDTALYDLLPAKGEKGEESNDPGLRDFFYYTASVDEDGIITFPDELIESLGWEEGDELVWEINSDNTVEITKLEKTVKETKEEVGEENAIN